MRKLKVGVIGMGSMGKNHARVYSELDSTNLVAIVDTDGQLRGQMEKKYRTSAYADYKEMMHQESLDIVSIAVPTVLHREVALEAINRGLHVLLEKPIASSLAEAEEIIHAAKAKAVKLLIGHIERFNPAVLELKRRIQQGELGKVFKVDVNRVGPMPKRIQDVGVVIDLAVHDIDIMRFLAESEPKRIYAEIEQRAHTKKEDLLAGLIRFENDTICYLNVNWLTPTRIRKLYITGEKGMFVIDYLTQDLLFYENEDASPTSIKEGNMIQFKINRKEPLRNEIEHFVDCVLNDKQPLVTGEDGKKALDISLKLIQSSQEGRILKND